MVPVPVFAPTPLLAFSFSICPQGLAPVRHDLQWLRRHEACCTSVCRRERFEWEESICLGNLSARRPQKWHPVYRPCARCERTGSLHNVPGVWRPTIPSENMSTIDGSTTLYLCHCELNNVWIGTQSCTLYEEHGTWPNLATCNNRQHSKLLYIEHFVVIIVQYLTILWNNLIVQYLLWTTWSCLNTLYCMTFYVRSDRQTF